MPSLFKAFSGNSEINRDELNSVLQAIKIGKLTLDPSDLSATYSFDKNTLLTGRADKSISAAFKSGKFNAAADSTEQDGTRVYAGTVGYGPIKINGNTMGEYSGSLDLGKGLTAYYDNMIGPALGYERTFSNSSYGVQASPKGLSFLYKGRF